jgi:hypothetical protein
MGNLMGLGGMTGGTAAPAAPIALPTPAAAPKTWDEMSPEQQQAYVNSPARRRQMKDYLLTGNEALDPSQTGLFAPDPQAAARAQTQSSYTKMQAPDGSVKDIPSQYVSHYSQLGAQIIH